MGKKDGKPRGRITAYAYFVQTCRDELKKKNPNESVVFSEFSRKCGEKWKILAWPVGVVEWGLAQNFIKQHKTRTTGDVPLGKWQTPAMSAKDKKRFEDFAAKDKVRYDKEMANYKPPAGGGGGGKRKKDPNAPKRALSAFFCFCSEERPKVKAKFPSYGVADVAKELGKRWEQCTARTKFEQLAAKDRQRYEREMAAYKGGAGKKAGAKAPAKKPAAAAAVADDDDEDEESDEEEDEDSD